MNILLALMAITILPAVSQAMRILIQLAATLIAIGLVAVVAMTVLLALATHGHII